MTMAGSRRDYSSRVHDSFRVPTQVHPKLPLCAQGWWWIYVLALSSQMPICLGTQGQGLERNGLEGSYHARSCTSLLLHPRAQGTYAKSGIYLDTKNYPEVKENDGFKENKTRRVLAGGQVLVGSHEFLVGSIAKRKTGEGDRTLTSHARGAMRTIKQFYKRVPTAYTEKGIARAMRKVVRRAVSR